VPLSWTTKSPVLLRLKVMSLVPLSSIVKPNVLAPKDIEVLASRVKASFSSLKSKESGLTLPPLQPVKLIAPVLSLAKHCVVPGSAVGSVSVYGLDVVPLCMAAVLVFVPLLKVSLPTSPDAPALPSSN
jgi:hypothetical protein